jgi:hypothetical protein
METSLVPNAPIPPSDATLLSALRTLGAADRESNPIVIGVEDAQGQVYRIVRMAGLCEAVRVFEAARALGFSINTVRPAKAANYQKVLRQRS